MDPATIAAAAVTILTPYVKDAGGELVKTVGEVSLAKAKDLLAWMKNRFAGDPVAVNDLSRFQADPATFGPSLHATIKQKAQSDSAFATELHQRIDEIGPDLVVFQRFTEGKNVVGIDADTIHSGKAAVTQEADKVDNMTGIRAKTIG
jgi:hypothetical protein